MKQLELNLFFENNPDECVCQPTDLGYGIEYIHMKRHRCQVCVGKGCTACDMKGYLKVCGCGHIVEPVTSKEKINPERSDYDCAVATAVFGTPLNPALEGMRRYRDELVAAGGFGARLSRYYNTVKAPVADLVRRNSIVRWGFLLIVIPIVSLQKHKVCWFTKSSIFMLAVVGVTMTGITHALAVRPSRRS